MSTICVDKENASKSTALIGKSLLTVNKSSAAGGGLHLMSCNTPNEKRSVSVLTPQLKKCPAGMTPCEITNTGKKRAFGANLLNTIASGKTPQLTVSHATPSVTRSKLGSRCHTQLKMPANEATESIMTTSDEDLLPPVEHCFANKYDDYADMHDYEAIDRLVEEIRATTAASRARSPIRIYVDNEAWSGQQQQHADEKSVRKMNKAIRKQESREMRSMYTMSSMALDLDMEMMPPPSLAGLKLDDDLDSFCFA